MHIDENGDEPTESCRLLGALIECAARELPAKSSPIKTSWVLELVSRGPSAAAHVTTAHFAERGLLLDEGVREIADPSRTSGHYDGAALYLLAGGRLLVLEYEGLWSETRASWVARAREVTIRAAARAFPLAECVAALEAALAEPQVRT